MSGGLSVVVADDTPAIRRAVTLSLRRRGHRVVAEAQTGAEAVTLAQALRPDVVVLDIRMPPTFTNEGLHAAALIGEHAPEVGVVVLSQYVEATWALRLMDRRTRGTAYLLKDRLEDLDLLDRTVRTTAAGGSVVDQEIVDRLLRRNSEALAQLTDRERTVLALMAAGRSNGGIAADLTLTGKTVESHVRAIFSKLALTADDDGHRRVRAVLKYLQDSS